MENTIYCLFTEYYDGYGFGRYYFFKNEKDFKEKNCKNAFLSISSIELEDIFCSMDNLLKEMKLEEYKVIYSYALIDRF